MQPSAPAKPFIKWQKGYMSETKRAQKNLTERKIFEKDFKNTSFPVNSYTDSTKINRPGHNIHMY